MNKIGCASWSFTMLHRRFWILFLVFFIFLFSTGPFLFQSKYQEQTLPSLVMHQKYHEMQSKLRELQSVIDELKTRNELVEKRQQKSSELQSIIDELKTRNQILEKRQVKSSSMPTLSNITKQLDRPPKHQLANDTDLFAALVTVILYRDIETPYSCLQTKENQLRQKFPKLEILAVKNTKEVTVGFQFNSLIPKVNTTYFFFLNTRHDLSDHSSDNSAGWLLHALENVPELDFVSGSILDDDKLEIPCYRLALCNWTLSRRYEYQKSIGELMICENIATSFMGRTSSVEHIRAHNKGSTFDEDLTSLSTTDFFLSAKQAGSVSGVRPEVFFQVDTKEECIASEIPDRRQKFVSLLPFAHKHKVFRFRDPDSEELDLCDLDKSPIVGEDICDESVAYKIMLDGGHWAYDGTFAYPFMIKNLQHCLFQVAKFLALKKIPFEIKGGVGLGTVKVRGVLPWDAGDIDIYVYNYSQSELSETMTDFVRTNDFTLETPSNGQVVIFCTPPKLARKVNGLVAIIPRKDDEIPSFIKMKTNGGWVSYRRKIFSELKHDYGVDYLQHKLYNSQEMVHCKKTGHNACLPDFRLKYGHESNTGTFKELFCNL